METIVESSSSSVFAARLPPGIPDRPVYRFNVDQYHRLYEEGIITGGVELLSGWITIKDPPEKLCALMDAIDDEDRDPDIPDLLLYRFSVEDYHTMLATGILQSGDPVELLEGYLVLKMTKHPPHEFAFKTLWHLLNQLIPDTCHVTGQSPIVCLTSEPEPDLSVLRGSPRDFLDSHPTGSDAHLVVEVADSSLDGDHKKLTMYAEAGVVEYWIVNLIDRQIEVYTQPSGPKKSPKYGRRKDYQPGQSVPLTIAGEKIGEIPVSDILP
jgi:Uma2 family endonuclease